MEEWRNGGLERRLEERRLRGRRFGRLHQEKFWQPVAACGSVWEGGCQGAPGSPREPQEAPGSFREPQGGPREPQGAPGREGEGQRVWRPVAGCGGLWPPVPPDWVPLNKEFCSLECCSLEAWSAAAWKPGVLQPGGMEWFGGDATCSWWGRFGLEAGRVLTRSTLGEVGG